jgi:hypothetical protein
MAGFKTQSKRIRELAKQNKRRVKDEKRALRKAERSGPVVGVVADVQAVAAVPLAKPAVSHRPPDVVPGALAARKPLTLAEAVERWKKTKVVKARGR